MPEEDSATRQFWDRDAAVQSLDAEIGALPYEIELIHSAINRAERTRPVERIEVLGVGTGRELSAIRSAAPTAIIRACDISPRMIAATQKTIERLGLTNVETIASDVDRLDSNDGPADVIIALSAVLCYPPHHSRGRTWANLHSMLRPGGALAAVVQQRNGRPDWAIWFAARAVASRLPLGLPEPGDRRSYDPTGHSVLFHHYTSREVLRHLEQPRYSWTSVRSLRAWAAEHETRIPRSSPNPLLVLGVT